jgi:hypothetical protein
MLRYADADTLWAARNTCSSVRKVADKLLLDTVSFTTPWEPSVCLELSGRRKRLLRTFRYEQLVATIVNRLVLYICSRLAA